MGDVGGRPGRNFPVGSMDEGERKTNSFSIFFLEYEQQSMCLLSSITSSCVFPGLIWRWFRWHRSAKSWISSPYSLSSDNGRVRGLGLGVRVRGWSSCHWRSHLRTVVDDRILCRPRSLQRQRWTETEPEVVPVGPHCCRPPCQKAKTKLYLVLDSTRKFLLDWNGQMSCRKVYVWRIVLISNIIREENNRLSCKRTIILNFYKLFWS